MREIKLAIVGSRNIHNLKLVMDKIKAIQEDNHIIEIISGGAPGVDHSAHCAASLLNIPFREIKANWKKYGRSAGPIRNYDIANECDVMLAIWDGKSPGTRNAIQTSEACCKPVLTIIEHPNKNDKT